MDWGLVAAAGLVLAVLVVVAVLAGEVAARLLVQASEAPRDRRRDR